MERGAALSHLLTMRAPGSSAQAQDSPCGVPGWGKEAQFQLTAPEETDLNTTSEETTPHSLETIL